MKKILNIVFLLTLTILFSKAQVKAVENCGQIVGSSDQCNCSINNNQASPARYGTVCCGWMKDNTNCSTYQDADQYGCGEIITSASVPSGATCNCGGTNWTAYWQWKGLNRGACCGYVKEGTVRDQCLTAPESETTAFCGEIFDPGVKGCICGGGGGVVTMSDGSSCCGWEINGQCSSTDVGINNIDPSAETLNAINPLNVGGSAVGNDLSTPGGILTRALQGFIFPIAGIILFAQLLLGGFQMLTGAASKGIDEGKQKITAAVIGFIILFAAYWIMQLLELIFGIRILS